MNESAKEQDRIVVKKSDSEHTISLQVVNNVLHTFEHDKEDYIRETLKYRLGKVLTIIDGAISDETQRKAVKDLIHDAWYSADRSVGAKIPHYIYEVIEALGLQLSREESPVPMPEDQYNPYKELVK